MTKDVRDTLPPVFLSRLVKTALVMTAPSSPLCPLGGPVELRARRVTSQCTLLLRRR